MAAYTRSRIVPYNGASRLLAGVSINVPATRDLPLTGGGSLGNSLSRADAGVLVSISSAIISAPEF